MVTKNLHKEKNVAKRPPYGEKVAERPPYGEKVAKGPPYGEKVAKMPHLQRKHFFYFPGGRPPTLAPPPHAGAHGCEVDR